MNRMRKYLAFALAMGLSLSSMTVFAYYEGMVYEDDDYKRFEGYKEPTAADGLKKGDYWYNGVATMQWNGSAWVSEGDDADDSSSSSNSVDDSSDRDDDSGSGKSAAQKEMEARAKAEAAAVKAALAQASAESVALEAEAVDSGFENGAELQLAKAASKSAGEYNNNAVVKTLGIENATPVAQGGGLVIDGKVTGATATISKVSIAFVNSVCAAQDGTVLNVVDVQFPATEAVVNFYMPGVAEGASIAAVQYVSGVWVDVEVIEVRADHVVLNLKSNGVVAFIAK